MKELNLIQTELNAPKSQHNNFGNFDYRSCEDILEALKPLLKETGCTVVLSDEIVLVGERHYVKATATITNESGESISNTAFAREPLMKKGSDESQITGATSSYARKYALAGLFCIDDNRDGDYEEQPTYDQNGMVVAPPPTTEKKRGRKKQTAPQEAPVQQPHFDQTLQFALQQVSLIADVEGIHQFWGAWKGRLKPEEESQLVDALHALPFYPKQ